MGKARKCTGRLPLKLEMRLVAGPDISKGACELMTKKLRADPTMAKKLGALMTRARDSFARAYPGQTRTRRIPNATLRKAGYDYIADLNEALGHLGS